MCQEPAQLTMLVGTGTSTTTAVDALLESDGFPGLLGVLFELGPGNSANAAVAVRRLGGLDALHAAQLLVALFLPLGDQHPVGVLLTQEPLVELLRDRVSAVEERVDVARTLVADPQDLPQRFAGPRRQLRALRLLHLPQLQVELAQRGLDPGEPFGRILGFGTYT